MANKKKVIVVGAGPGGLTGAMILARRGFDVTVFEARDVVGGRNAALRAEGYTFDMGPTFLMMNFVLREMFEEAGREVEKYLRFKRLDPLYCLKFDDRDVLVSPNHEKMKAEIARKFPGNEGGMERFLEAEKKRFEFLFPCIQKHYSTLGTLFSWTLLKALPYLSPTRSIFQALGRYFKQDKLKLCFTFQSKYLGMSPWKCPALFTMLPYVEHEYGIYHVMGGLNQISEAMAKVVQEEGGRVRTGTPVKSLIVENKKVKGVLLENGETVYADDVVINADFAHAMTHLVEPGVLKKYSRESLAKKEYSCSTFMLYLGVNKRYDMDHHTIVFAGDYRKNVSDIFDKKVLSDDISFYIQNASATDPGLAPEGKSAVYVLVPVPNRMADVDWPTHKKVFRDKVLALIEERTPMKDLRRHIETETVFTPHDWETTSRVYRGATFNLAHNFSQLLYLRPRNRFEELENCFLVGGGTHPGSGLPTIYESARISANLLCDKHGVAYTPPSKISEKTMRSGG
jgi:phytoene desaturase